MSVNRRRLLQIIALVASIAAYTTIVLGGTVRGMGAGLACPDWPLCHGSIVPDLADPNVAVEYAHRLAAALTSISLLLAFLSAFFWFRTDKRLVVTSFAAFAILATQVAIGALTIESGLDWVIVTVHLALGTATFATSLMVALLSFVGLRPTSPERASPD